MAERKKTGDEAEKKDAPKKSAPKKAAAKTAETKKSAPKAAASKSKSGDAKKTEAKSGGAKASAKTKESAAKSGGAKATSKTADTKASETAKKGAAESESKAPAKRKATSKPAAKKAAPKEEPQRPVVNARARFVRVAPRKARLVANQVRGMPLEEALALLRFHPRSASRDIAKVLDSAAANAEANHDLVADELKVSDITVDDGPTLRRYRPRALGRATKINKRTSHIRVALTPED